MEARLDAPMAHEVTDLDRHSYNAAFYELGLRWHWDEASFRELMKIDDCEARLAHYLRHHQPHMLSAYDCGFLCRAIEQARSALLDSMDDSEQALRHPSQFDWTEFHRATPGV